jgi:metallo-beta-lactamase family protein
VNADIVNVPAFSVHADQGEILDWLGTAPTPPQVAFVVHGEPSGSEALRARIAKDLHWNVAVPKNLERVRLS